MTFTYSGSLNHHELKLGDPITERNIIFGNPCEARRDRSKVGVDSKSSRM